MGQSNQRDFFGIIIPVKILENADLSVSEKFVYAYVASYAKYCADENAKIARRIGVSVKTVSRSLAKLRQLGYVEFKYVNSSSASRRIIDTYRKERKSKVTTRKKPNSREERRSFPQSFSQLLHNALFSGQNVQPPGQNVQPNNR